MSYGEELMVNMLIEAELLQAELEEEYRKLSSLADLGIWVKQDGTQMRIEDMDSRHIMNSIAMMKRNAPFYSKRTLEITARYRAVMEKELQKRFPPEDPAFAWG